MTSGETNGKIFKLTSLRTIQKLSDFLKSRKNIILAGGCFDILHYGHITFLRKAKVIGGTLVVLLESDRAMIRKKKRKPIHSQKKRAEILAAVRYVDFIIMIPYLTNDHDYKLITTTINPAVIAVTKGDKQLGNKKKYARLTGANVRIVTPRIGGLSTSTITKYATISSD